MAEETIYSEDIAGYTHHGVIRVVYKSVDNADYTNAINVFTCDTCSATVLGDSTTPHTAWHNQGASA
jgi:hypothetical protein